MKTAEIAQRYLDYFEKNDHVIVPSASLVTDDPSLLFTVAGMVLGEGYSNVEVWIDPVSKVVKVLLVIAVLAGGIWLGLRIWRRRQSPD